jgi:release factor glutamine methyltransferase
MAGEMIRHILTRAAALLEAYGVDSPRLSAELLLARVLGTDRLGLVRDPDRRLGDAETEAFQALLKRRAEGCPVAYLLGEKEFYGLRFRVTPDVLVPRPETERVVEEAERRLPKDAPLLLADLGTGSGILAVTLATRLPLARVWAADASPAALDLARANARAHGVEGRIAFVRADMTRPLFRPGSLDCLVANPPYVSDAEFARVSREVRDFEPRLALLAGADGLDCIRPLLALAATALRPGGLVLVEIGAGQGEAVRGLAEAAGLTGIEILKDLAGLDRALAAEVPSCGVHGRRCPACGG